MRKDLQYLIHDGRKSKKKNNPEFRIPRFKWHESMSLEKIEDQRTKRMYNWGCDFNSNHRTEPLKRWLRKQVGRPWNDVYSELCELYDKRSKRGRTIHSQLDWMILDNNYEHHRRWYSYYYSEDLIIKDGVIALRCEGKSKRRKLAEYRFKDNDTLERNGRFFIVKNDCWFERIEYQHPITKVSHYEKRPPVRFERLMSYDGLRVLREAYEIPQRDEPVFKEVYETRYRYKQLKAQELKKFNLLNGNQQ